ncbi:MAG: YbgC/FadM family acyl-CoA thioesterase [Candidatus Symbiobacter sp.]|nr:YbgC/FadM family acyl-CoA thioesterase [Candidatus Symbiobacter sp.]
MRDHSVQPQATDLPPLHQCPMRVVYADTDAGGVVYHARYLDMAERARAEMMFALGLSEFIQSKPGEPSGNLLVVRRVEIDYLRPARLYDDLTVTSYVKKLGGSSFDLLQEISGHDQILVRINLVLVWIDGQFRPQRLPARLRQVLAARGV